jgi:hypothetical protein
MKKILFVFNLMLLSTLIANGEEKPLLKFKPDATFKIVQFTDTHLQYDSYRSDSVLVMMKKVIEREKPDLVILTGDVVGSDNRKRAWLKVAQVMIDAKTPWAAMFGNHDAEYELDKEQTMDIIVGLPYSLTERGPKGVNGLSNYILPIQSSTSSKTAALCYVLDISETAYPLEDQTGTFTWIDDSQVEWYKKESAAYASQNGGTPIPALAFFHIPFPEFNEVAGKSTTVGVQWELNPAPPRIRSNLFAAMQSCKDVMGVFVGHHHNNNYIGCLDDICLAFGQNSGRQAYGDLGAGARVIVLHEGERRFDSWILKLYENSRDRDIWHPAHSMEPLFFVSYPDHFRERLGNPGKINMVSRGVNSATIRLSGKGKATVDWGDGSAREVINLSEKQELTIRHAYPDASIHVITINGSYISALECNNNGLTYLDTSHAPELSHLDCSGNQLPCLDLSGNGALKVLWCNRNLLSELKLSNNSQLTELYCHDNLLAQLDLSSNRALIRVNCSRNRLKSLELNSNAELTRMDCYENQISTLDFSNNKKLNYAVCSDNQLTTKELNRLFSTFWREAAGKIFIGGNPGEKECDRSIAEKRGWKVSLRY